MKGYNEICFRSGMYGNKIKFSDVENLIKYVNFFICLCFLSVKCLWDANIRFYSMRI